MLLRFDPFRELDRVAAPTPRQTRTIPMDAVQSEHAVEIRFDLPGFDPASIDLEVDRNVLTLRAERPWVPAEGERVVARERASGSFFRQLRLSDQLDGGNVEAEYRDGVLRVRLPIAEAAKPRKISIEGVPAPALDVDEPSAN
jgi:HSP20 family protein